MAALRGFLLSNADGRFLLDCGDDVVLARRLPDPVSSETSLNRRCKIEQWLTTIQFAIKEL